ncbi:MAG TPA: hypothetical protein ENJ21_07160 [Chromatiaceae bacterium]|nr:hypothetical protein [Chromatiaceae bacterium]
MGVNLVARLWGFSEATLFFIVPDVWLTLAARENPRPGLIACLHALGGALIGGTCMYQWGAWNTTAALHAVEGVPAIGGDMVASVRDALRNQGITAVLIGPLSGTPYKLYAVQAAQAGISLAEFLLISIPARLGRFALVTLGAHYALQYVAKRRPTMDRRRMLLICWAIFYIGYLGLMPW